MASTQLQKAKPLLLPVNTVCAQLSICRTTLYELMKEGCIAYVMVGGRRRVPVTEVERIVGEARRDALI